MPFLYLVSAVYWINFEGGDFCGLDNKTFSRYIFEDYN